MRKISIRLMRNCKSGKYLSGKYISINFSKKQIAKQHSLENFLAIGSFQTGIFNSNYCSLTIRFL